MKIRIVGFNLRRDSSTCLVEDGVIRSALALERTTRIEHGSVPRDAHAIAMADLVGQLLDDADLTTSDIDYWIAADPAPTLDLIAPPERTLHMPDSRHLAHASAAFYSSGYEEAAALVVGSSGETGLRFRIGETPERVLDAVQKDGGQTWLPDRLTGLGELYRLITAALGFRDCAKTMDLASHGKPLSAEALFVEPAGEGELSFEYALDSLVELGLAVSDNGRLRLVPRPSRQPFDQFHHDLAAQIQAEFEQAVLHRARGVLARTGSRSLVVSGGAFLNPAVNTRIRNETEIDRLFVFPAAGNDGNAVGAALYAYHNLVAQPSTASPALQHVYLGPSRVAGQDIEALATEWLLPVHRPRSVTKAAAAAIARGEIVGWFADRAEFGPRALGARSILCHPGIEGIKDRLNGRVKSRESFRPFAGSILAEQAGQWFGMPAPDSRFMQYSCPVLAHRRDMAGELGHVDGTCRVQTVAEDDPGRLRGLIESFEDLTGLPVVLTTEFSLPGMPIVEYPQDALDCLYSSRLDRLFIGDLEIEPPDRTTLRPVTGPGTRQNATAALSSTGTSTPLAGLDQLGLRILELADGVPTMRDIAGEIDTDPEKAIDLALEMKRQGLLHWAGRPPHPSG
ncbi:carbamoyltransferase [Kibdelosporangium banguiense]|uniref:Carbamoyltransferase n=1 Tax=Kibdelosporangium banguiense TaxID=1365924 RepID=A0ABS4TQX3_9PSEU|nr:carbamoyltransferase C-terminal domain-containing protein [Kibdelosporangium banguiense]MBP2326805.1 carbamoyltransferase [Kibdelosporangium banguiense]